MRNKKGISLIVLVITIIVMIILAASVVITLTNTGIIERADQAVKLTDAQQINQLASIAWGDAFMSGVRTQEGLESAVINTLTSSGVNVNEYDINVTTTGVALNEKKIYTADEIAADANIFAVGLTNANDVVGIYNPDTKTLTIRSNVTTGDVEMKPGTYSASLFSTLKATLEHVVVENGVKNVSKYLFYNFKALKSVTMANSVKAIDNVAFYGCTALTDVKMSNNLETIGSESFGGCTALAKLYIPSTVTSIGTYAISGKTCSVEFGEGFDITLETIKDTAFAHYACGSASAMANYKIAVEYGDGTSTKVDKPFACSNGTQTIHDYEYTTNMTVNGKTRRMSYHHQDYCATCNY